MFQFIKKQKMTDLAKASSSIPFCPLELTASLKLVHFIHTHLKHFYYINIHIYMSLFCMLYNYIMKTGLSKFFFCKRSDRLCRLYGLCYTP